MSVVRINAITVPEGRGDDIEERFKTRLGAVDGQPGFLGFELLRPTGESERRWFVMTRWESAEAFEKWVESDDFRHGHAQSIREPIGTGAQLMEFDVVQSTLRLD